MKLTWDFDEVFKFGNNIGNLKMFEEYCGKATQDIAKQLHKFLISRTPVDFGTLQAFWQTEENYAYTLVRTATGVEVTLYNRAQYATWVNDGHRQRPGRFIPGVWVGGHFRYDPNADGGMVLKKSWVKGKFFVESSVLDTEEKMQSILYKQLSQWFRWCVNGK